ncbi:RNA polymerase-associated protein rtf1 [Malassezia cuniculi]|uniref:RNA polymerase-associated protein rtf1 n=1 Tax=Malassezia cuniculi TaxID=948313 RepID=A0AAF0EVQ4_9BASI|nr:RNA polymerase-associated protein rtf1 [Malassezia cuniculi]
MSEDGLDEELIALVGEDATSPPPSPPSTTARRRRKALLGDSSSDASGDEGVPYPLEGIYKDEADREWLLSLNELEREDVLSQRRDELSRRSQQAQLAAMVRSQQGAGRHRDEQRAKRRKRSHADIRRELADLADSDNDVFRESDSEDEQPRGASATRTARLSELRRRRERRGAGVSDSEESESEYEEAPARRVRGASPALAATSSEPPTLAQLNAVRVGRDTIERMMFVGRWKDVFRGCFVRCSWGMRERKGGDGAGGREHIYRVHQITGIVQRDKHYDMSTDKSGRWSNTYVSFEWNGKEHTVDLRPLSTQPITESERERWIATRKAADDRYPSADALAQKQEQLGEFLSAPLTEEDIKRMIELKRELRASALEAGHGVAATVDSAETAEPAKQPGGTHHDEHLMAQINERNRRADRERIQEAERRAAQAKKRAAAQEPKREGTVPTAPAIAAALEAAPAGSGVVPTLDIDLGDF